MSYIKGYDRQQAVLFPKSIDQLLAKDNVVRFLDIFVDSLDIPAIGFTDVNQNVNGRPPYHPKDLLKLYIYGYLNKIRASRKLENECKRNIELMWLMSGLVPDHNTISNFRRDNPKAIKKVFRLTVELAKNYDLIGGILLAGDGTKLRAQNSKKNNYNQKKIDRHIAYIENKLAEHCQALAKADGDEEKKKIQRKIAKHNKHKKQYQAIEKQIKETGEKQVSTSDPEARQIMVRGMISEVCYNVQSTVDAKHNLPINYQVTNKNDSRAMLTMVEQAIEIVGNNTFDAVFDKGYHTAEEIHKVQQLGITTHVSIPKQSSSAPNKAYNVSEFQYNEKEDTYTCPAGQTLRTNGNWYQKKSYRVKQYKTKNCYNCPVKSACTKSKYIKLVERHEFVEALKKNKQNIANNPEIYAQRQAIVEHPFGTMKRGWGFDHIITKKTKKRAAADVGLIFTAYLLKRLINIIGMKTLIEYFGSFSPIILIKSYYKHFFNSLKAIRLEVFVFLRI